MIYEFSLLTHHVTEHGRNPVYKECGRRNGESGFVMLELDESKPASRCWDLDDPFDEALELVHATYNISLLQVCRQIYDEAYPIFAMENPSPLPVTRGGRWCHQQHRKVWYKTWCDLHKSG